MAKDYVPHSNVGFRVDKINVSSVYNLDETTYFECFMSLVDHDMDHILQWIPCVEYLKELQPSALILFLVSSCIQLRFTYWLSNVSIDFRIARRYTTTPSVNKWVSLFTNVIFTWIVLMHTHWFCHMSLISNKHIDDLVSGTWAVFRYAGHDCYPCCQENHCLW